MFEQALAQCGNAGTLGLIATFSMGCPVLGSPDCAVQALKDRMRNG